MATKKRAGFIAACDVRLRQRRGTYIKRRAPAYAPSEISDLEAWRDIDKETSGVYTTFSQPTSFLLVVDTRVLLRSSSLGRNAPAVCRSSIGIKY